MKQAPIGGIGPGGDAGVKAKVEARSFAFATELAMLRSAEKIRKELGYEYTNGEMEMNYWLGTASGKKIDLENPDYNEICIEDIALALSKISRFNGHTNGTWSVLQHSIAVARLVAPEFKLQALLHDAAEAYICDIPTPLKHLLGESYRAVERRIITAIGMKFNVSLMPLPEPVKFADAMMLMTEHERFQSTSLKWEQDYSNGMRAPRSIFDQSNNPQQFINYFHNLKGLE